MATSLAKAKCFTCDKVKITYECKGCSKDFCLPHLTEHSQTFSQQFDEIENDRAQFQQLFIELKENPKEHLLMQQINKWENDSIEKIKQKAEECRQLFIEHTNKYINETENKLIQLTKQLKEIRQESEFNEIDLNQLKLKLTKLRQDLDHSPNISVRQDSTPLINKISVIRSSERISTKQQQLPKLNLDPINNHRQSKAANSKSSIDVTSLQKSTSDRKVYKNGNSGQLCSNSTNTPTEHNRKLHTSVKKENNVLHHLRDGDSDYLDDLGCDTNEIPKSTAVLQPPSSEAKTSNNSLNLIPSDPTAFEASFCRKRQAAIDNMSYRQAVDRWTAKGLHDVVKLINDLSSGKSLIDRAWIIFYWISQNIEYDVEAYFSGNIRHQTSEDIFRSRKGVCEAFATIFETLCTTFKIECKKISGYAKGYGFKVGQKSFTQTNHAWNVLRLDGHWYLVDSTWGTGHLDINNRFQKKLDLFYFLVRPEQMIYKHLPGDSKWQLLTSPLSMVDFFRLPYVYSTFFEHHLDLIYPRNSNTASFNSSLGLAEVLVRAPSDVSLTGDITEAGSNKIKNGSLIQYDAERQQWQCLFAPRRSGLHTLMIFSRRNKQTTRSESDDSNYSCAIKLSLHAPTDLVKTKTFPLTYGLFIERKCQIFEPLGSTLKPGSKVTIHCRIPDAYCARLKLDGNWLAEDILKDGIFKRQITIPQREIAMYVQFSDKRNNSSYEGLFCYTIQ